MIGESCWGRVADGRGRDLMIAAAALVLSLGSVACQGQSGQAPPPAPPPSASTPKPIQVPTPTAKPVVDEAPPETRAPTPTAKPAPPANLPEVSPEDQAKAKSLNAKGYEFYKQKRYSEAIKAFEEASVVDPTYALPPYNLACTLCLVRGGEGTCAEDAYMDRIVGLVETSVQLDPARLERAKEDSDLNCIHRTMGYQALMGFPVSQVKNIPHLLTHVDWFGPAPGAFGNMSQLTFKAGGKLTLWELDTRGDEIKRIYYNGTYVVDGNRVIVRLETPTMHGVQGFTGVVTIDGIATDSTLGPFTDIPSECSA